MDKDILIWGAGAIGGTLGAYLVRAGYHVTFVDVMQAHVAAIGDPARGLRISGPLDAFTVHAPAFMPQTLTGTWRRIFLAVKAQDTLAAAQALDKHLAPDGFVASFQNGLCEPYIASVVGVERTVGAFVNFGADWIGPGEVLFANRAAVVVGELDGRRSARVTQLHADLLHFEPEAIVTDDIASFLWGKLAYGALLHAQAVGQLGIADCLARPELLPVWRAIGHEVHRVAAAEKIAMRGFNGFAPEAFTDDASEAALRATVDAMVAFNRPNVKTHSGIWRDLAVRKRKTEVDMQLGEVIRAGAKHGLACPTLAALSALIHEIEDGERPLADENLLELLTPATA